MWGKRNMIPCSSVALSTSEDPPASLGEQICIFFVLKNMFY